MNFTSALMSLQRGHRVARSHWSGYWELEKNEIIMHTYDGRLINIRDSEDMMYTISNMICDDWNIVDDYGTSKEINCNILVKCDDDLRKISNNKLYRVVFADKSKFIIVPEFFNGDHYDIDNTNLEMYSNVKDDNSLESLGFTLTVLDLMSI